MADPADQRADFRDAMRRAEEDAGITRDASGNEVYASTETPVVTPELEGAVPIAASDQPLEPEPAVTPPVVAADTSEQQQEAPAVVETLTVEQLQVKLADAEARLAEKDSFIGRQSGEVGELRKVVDELSARVDQAQAQPVAPVQQAPTIAITQELIDADPQRATLLAYAQGNQQALEVAFNEWKEIDPFTSGQWLTDRRLEKQAQEFDEKITATKTEFTATTAPLAESREQEQEQAVWNVAFIEMQKKHADFLVVDETTGKSQAQRLLEEVAPQFPRIARMIAEGDAEAKVEGLTILYNQGKFGNPAHVEQELKDAAETAAAEAAATRAAAGAVSGQDAAGQPAVEQTESQAEAERYKARMSTRPSLTKGWTGRA